MGDRRHGHSAQQAVTGGGLGVVAYLGAWLTTIGGIWFLFEKADETLAPDVRHRVTRWLRSQQEGPAHATWPGLFLELFDRTFGRRHLTWKCFQRSAVASMSTVWIVALAWMLTHPPPSLSLALSALFTLTLMGVVLNLVPDYLSLLETRWLLGAMKGPGGIAVLLAADLVATGALGIAGYAVLYGVAYGLPELPHHLWRIVSLQASLAAFGPGTTARALASADYAMPLGAFFYSTFFTSAWAWLFALSGIAVRVSERSRRAASQLWRVTDVDEKPFRALGLAAVIAVTALFVAGVPIVLLLRRAG